MSFMQDTGNSEGLAEAIAGAGKDFIDYDPIGLPDETDAQNIRTMIRNFDKLFPGLVAAFVKQAKEGRRAHEESFIIGTKKDEPRRPVLSMPLPLFRDIEEAYPLMFRNKKHLQWFKTNFPQFNTR